MWPLVICLLLAHWSISAAHSECNFQCSTDPLVTKQIPPGRQIRLAYLAQYVNTVPGMTGNQTGLDIKMDIVVTAVNSCRFVMDLENVQVFYYEPTDILYTLHPGLTEVYSKALTKYAVWHRHVNRLTECIWWHDEEELWVRNFKRGILSVAQVNMKETEFWETGVTGTCRVKQTITRSPSQDEVFVHKEYDTSNCYDQPKQITSTVALNPQQNPIGSQFYSMSLRSWLHGKLVPVVGMMWMSIDIESVHQFTPFGLDGGVLTSSVSQNVQFVSFTTVDVPTQGPSQECQCSSILFEFPDANPPDECDPAVLKPIETMTDFLASNFKQPGQIRYAKEFLELVNLLRKACPKQLKDLWISYNNRMMQREIFLDALPAVCTDASVKTLTGEVMTSNLVSVRRMHSILKDMHFCDRTTKSMVRHYKNYVAKTPEVPCVNCANMEDFDLQDLKMEQWLLLGTMVRQLGCQEEHSTASVDFLETKLQTLVEFWNELKMECVRRDITAVIEALGNAGCVRSLDTLSDIFENWRLPTEIRTAAIRATRLMTEMASRRVWQLTLEVCSNATNPTEVRIAAWDIMMETASGKFPVPYENVSAVIMGLEYEKDIQYASYAWSWLIDWADNYEVNDRRAIFCQSFLRQTGAIYWGRKFNLGYLSSKFNVMSWSPCCSNQVRVVVKSRVVFDGDSTMPHSASVELDLHLLGQKIPVFMLEGQMEGASWMVENLFGPVGYFATKKTYSFQCGFMHIINVLMKPFPEDDLDIAIHFSMFGRDFRHWARSRCWFEEYMRNSPLYDMTNALWWVFHDTGYNMSDTCPWTIESPLWHKETGLTWDNAVDAFQRAREMLTVWKMFYDGTIWERALEMDATSVLVETNIIMPSIIGLPIFVAGNVTAHMSLETTGSVQLPQPASSSLWPQAVWNHLWKIWNIWTKPQKVEWQAEINPRINIESAFAMGFDAHFGGCSMEVEMSAESNQIFQFEGTLEPDDYTVSYKISPSDSGVTNLASYNSEFNFKHWDLNTTIRTPIVGDIPLEKKIHCTPKALTGVELCVQYQYYNSTDTWAPYYPLNGPSSGNILLSTADKPCEFCGYEEDTCCTYNETPTKIMGRVLKTATDDFAIFFEGSGSSPMRRILVNYRRDRNYPTGMISANFSWNTCQGPQYVKPVAEANLVYRWDRVDLQSHVWGKARTWEMESFSWMNRTSIESNTTYFSYEKDTQNMCQWKKADDPYRILINGSLVKRKEGQMRVEIEDPWHVKHWWQGSTTFNHLMTKISMNSSLFNGQEWNFGLPLPHPIDTASCHVFGRNFITFDRLQYAVAMSGSYILARSISADNFTVILHHGGLSKARELEIWFAGTTYQLTSEGLTVNSTVEMIPYRSCLANVTMWNTSCNDSYVRFSGQAGLEIYYNSKAIEVSVNGFYFKRMRGLCGNNNNNRQKIDEWQRSDGEVPAKVTDFVDSWKITGSAATTLPHRGWSQTAVQMCDYAFSRDSMEPLSQEIDMESFYRACLVEVENSGSKLENGVCSVVSGIKVAAFSRDFALPSVCWYGPWTNWMTDPKNENVEFREREPTRRGCDTCCVTQREYRMKDENLVYECDPWTSQQVIKASGQSKKCLSVETFQTCPSQCQSLVGPSVKTKFRCSSSFELLNEAPVITMNYYPAVKCICPTPCWQLQETATCG